MCVCVSFRACQTASPSLLRQDKTTTIDNHHVRGALSRAPMSTLSTTHVRSCLSLARCEPLAVVVSSHTHAVGSRAGRPLSHTHHYMTTHAVHTHTHQKKRKKRPKSVHNLATILGCLGNSSPSHVGPSVCKAGGRAYHHHHHPLTPINTTLPVCFHFTSTSSTSTS